jgi:signal transduction histidine kinase
VPRRHIPTGRLRRRLTIAFILVAGLSAGGLAAGSYLLVRQDRLQDSLNRAESEARLDLLLATGVDFAADGPVPRQFLQGYESRGDHAVVLVGNQRLVSNLQFDPPIPGDLRRLAQTGKVGFIRETVEGVHVLVVGARAPGSNAELYFVFSEDGLFADLDQLRNVLLVGWLGDLVVAGLVGRLLARSTLAPVGQASLAARRMAEGLLATRLPVESQDEFGAWALSFNQMAEALESKIAALSEAQARERRFTSDVAHELRTPLTALVGEASLLREHLDQMPPGARRPAELLIQDVGRLRRLVDELMEIARFDAGRESVRFEEVDILALTKATVRARGWEGRVPIDGERLVVATDRRRLERIVSNLVGNALEHGGRDVRVTVAPDGPAASIEVTDRGPGIAPEHLSHLFERFYKADPSRTAAGSGLGLAITLENVKLLGGDIEVWSEVGTGTQFTVRLPVTHPVTQRLLEGETTVTPFPDARASG